MAYTRILVGTDGSATADKAVETAADLARQLGAELHVVTAYRARAPGMGSASGAAMADSGGAGGLHTEAAKQIAEKAAAHLGRGTHQLEAHAASGAAADAILETAEIDRRRPDRGRQQGHARAPAGCSVPCPTRWPTGPAARSSSSRRTDPSGRPDSARRLARRCGPAAQGTWLLRAKSSRSSGIPDTPASVRTARTWCSSMRRCTKPRRDAARYRRHTRARPSPTSATASSQWASRLAPHAAHVRA